MIDRKVAQALDARDPLGAFRDRFDLPDGIIYLDGNSLGAMPKSVPARMKHAVEQEWARGLIRSWNDADWYPAPQRVGARIARLIGASADEVVVADSTSVNLFKVLTAALALRAKRRKIVTLRDDFPTDLYVAEGIGERADVIIAAVEPDALLDAIDGETAAVSLTQVNFRTGRRYDMGKITRRAHEAGALIVWDLCHTAGAMPCDLNGAGADFAVGCGYKYLNGGPGAPAFVFAAKRHHATMRPALRGWHGHARPFDFSAEYQPAPGMARFLVGTAPQLSLIALEAALDAFDGVDLAALRDKSVALTELFIRLVDQHVPGFGLASPRDPEQRGSQVSLAHSEGYAIMQALIAQGVIGDFRAPDILRFGFAPLYTRYVDVWDAVMILGDVMAKRPWRGAGSPARKAVT